MSSATFGPTPLAAALTGTTPSVGSVGSGRIGLGMAALGRPGYINLNRSDVLAEVRDESYMQAQSERVMDEAFRCGVRWFDCARSYGKAEKFVGDYLRKNDVAPDDVYVSSKWGYTYVADWNIQLPPGEKHEVKDHSVDNFLRQIQETSDCLGEYVNLYQIHSATLDSGALTNAALHEALARECRDRRGWTIGLSVSGPRQDEVLREAIKIIVDGKRLFDSVQCTYNLLEQRPSTALLEAQRAGMDIIVKEGMGNGRIFRHPVLLEVCKKAAEEESNLFFSEKESPLTPDQLALGCILAQPFEPRVLSGALLPEHLESNAKAQNVSDKLKSSVEGRQLLKELMDGCVMDSEVYWEERSQLSWN